MVNNYPLIYKIRVCAYYHKNKKLTSINEILKIFSVSNGSLYNWLALYDIGELKEKKQYTKVSIFTPAIKCFIRSYILKYANFDYNKLIKSIKRKYDVPISKSSLYDIIGKLNITRKKFKMRIVPNKNKYKKQKREFKKKIKKNI
ncbi:MAG: HTH and integrase core domain protein [Barrevirus sp.]|uniref:HTH and integrase core domain protein n=1 Tax=Barrevirus sp. TaxID=2487763 RepID=A0A3G4ZQE4_9VIRU|nr:MAG: HTH and integrase core domain protein [Barrevirus sp.]